MPIQTLADAVSHYGREAHLLTVSKVVRTPVM